MYKVQLINSEKGLNTTIEVDAEEYILDAAKRQGVALPYSCCAGTCVTYSAKLIKGKVYQDTTFLKPKEIEAGFVLTCKSYAQSDCILLTHQEDALLDL